VYTCHVCYHVYVEHSLQITDTNDTFEYTH
jgi:hypothetical protein